MDYDFSIKKDTPELREKLVKIGYKLNFTENRGLLYCDKNGNVYNTTENNNSIKNVIYGCGDQEELFLELAKYREDECFEQWYVCDKLKFGTRGRLGKIGNFFLWDNHMDPAIYGDMLSSGYYHKASIAEIIQHFEKRDLEYCNRIVYCGELKYNLDNEIEIIN